MIEKRQQERWQTAKCYEAEVDKNKEKKYLTAAFPYPNSPQHIGHARTYTTTDVYARYLRLRGYNVLFPMAFHVTGTPILAMAKRLEEKDEGLLKIFEEIYGIPREKAEKLTKPEELVMFFSKEIEQGMKEMGFSIDWRRKFYTFDKPFNKFIQWQFKKLKEKGYLVKGEYPIAWCPKDKNALSAHDTKGDVDPEIETATIIKFKTTEGAILITTYRPETIFGVTNLWINPEAEYVIADFNGEKVILSKASLELLKHQLTISEIKPIDVERILDLKATNPLTEEELPILPAKFVLEDMGTGIVMSVPGHAPLDYLALRDLGKLKNIPIIIEVKNWQIPAKEVVEKLNIKNQLDPLTEKATEEVYKKEAHEGRMSVEPFKGMPVKEAREKVIELLLNENKGIEVHILANRVYCRCGALAVVNILKDQWFIDYGNEKWKAQAKEWLKEMKIIPEKLRQEFEYTIEWLDKRPTTRSKGLGTRFPFDESKMIEALSDSTIYMAYYTIAHLINNGEIAEEELTDEFFDFVFLGLGEGKENWKKARESFLYWYPCDSRHSASDLVRNHLTLYIFNHIAVFKREHWPRQIVTNGFVTMEGSKMSKSMGNILPLRKAIEKYGADVIRFSVVSGADLESDSDFSNSVAEGVKTRLEFFTKLISEAKEGEIEDVDMWLMNRLNKKIEIAKELYEKVALRHLALELFYDVYADIHWYLRRANSYNLKPFFEKWIILISPFIPHHAEEYWKMLGKEGFVINEQFPESKEIDEKYETAERMVMQLHKDIEKVISLVSKQPKKIKIYVASKWKRELIEKALELKDFKKTLEYAKDKYPMDQVSKILKSIMKKIYAINMPLEEEFEYNYLKNAEAFFSKEFKCSVEINRETEEPKAKQAMPGKPSILIE